MTWLYENVTCDDLHCGTLVYRTAELPQGREVTPGFWQEANRVILKLDNAADALREEGRQRYGEELSISSPCTLTHSRAFLQRTQGRNIPFS
ncbi:hypothetical protein GCM10017783_19610 [Deinococcus piscis]|uniref:Uncharacterized protein n=1 Tax=Deinococcus piscis TaxID=394230 RepID=A0ABQ3K9J3_9DEIO|nr:hypothetical protein [Deinococcus piscis]GHG07091.1 hypothetical protein GCM10017783_19610 [Deinococcus piscis]